MTVIDPAPAIARQVARVIEQQKLLSAEKETGQIFYTTGNVEAFAGTLEQLLGMKGDIRRACWNNMRLTAVP